MAYGVWLQTHTIRAVARAMEELEVTPGTAKILGWRWVGICWVIWVILVLKDGILHETARFLNFPEACWIRWPQQC